MNFKNDYERLAYYEAKMNYYGSKLNDADGGMFGRSNPEDKAKKAEDKKKAVDNYNDFNTKLLKATITEKKIREDALAKAKLALTNAQSALTNAQLALTNAQSDLTRETERLTQFNMEHPKLSQNIAERDRLAKIVKDLGGTV